MFGLCSRNVSEFAVVFVFSWLGVLSASPSLLVFIVRSGGVSPFFFQCLGNVWAVSVKAGVSALCLGSVWAPLTFGWGTCVVSELRFACGRDVFAILVVPAVVGCIYDLWLMFQFRLNPSAAGCFCFVAGVQGVGLGTAGSIPCTPADHTPNNDQNTYFCVSPTYCLVL